MRPSLPTVTDSGSLRPLIIGLGSFFSPAPTGATMASNNKGMSRFTLNLPFEKRFGEVRHYAIGDREKNQIFREPNVRRPRLYLCTATIHAVTFEEIMAASFGFWMIAKHAQALVLQRWRE